MESLEFHWRTGFSLFSSRYPLVSRAVLLCPWLSFVSPSPVLLQLTFTGESSYCLLEAEDNFLPRGQDLTLLNQTSHWSCFQPLLCLSAVRGSCTPRSGALPGLCSVHELLWPPHLQAVKCLTAFTSLQRQQWLLIQPLSHFHVLLIISHLL